jgi:hypothetical protein
MTIKLIFYPLILVTVFMIAGVCRAERPRNVAFNSSKSAAEIEYQSDKNQKKPDPSASQNQVHPTSSEDERSHTEAVREQITVVAPKGPKDEWDKAYVIANYLLVLVAALTFGAIVVQAVETKRATKAIEEQTVAVRDTVLLQKTLKRQWLNLENWNITGERNQTGERTLISLSFIIINPTDMELEFKGVEVMTLEGSQGLTPNMRLAPNKHYSALFHIKLSKEQTTGYFNNSLLLHIMGILYFKDNFGDNIQRVFGEDCIGGESGFDYRPFDRWLSNEEDEN